MNVIDRAPPAKAASRAATVQKVRTKAGFECWLVEDYAVPLVAFDFAWRGGNVQDPDGREGASAMLAALLDEGAGPYDSDAFHRALDDKAVEISFGAERDLFKGQLKTLSRHVDAAFDFLRLAVNEARLDSDAIERVRSQMIAGLKHEAKDPDALAGRAFREAAFPGHRYSRAGRGTLDSVPLIAREDLVRLRADMMARDNIKIAAVGAIDAGRLAALIDSVFATLPPAASLVAVPDVQLAGLGTRKVVDVDVPQSTLRFALQGVARTDPDYMIASVVNHILGGGVFSARLFKEVREKRGLAYSVHTSLANWDHASLFSGGTSTKNERAAESLTVIEEEIAKLAADGPTAEELDKAKKYLTGSYVLRFDTSTKICDHLVHLQTEGYPVEYLDERNGLIEAVTLDDAKRVAARLFDGKKLLVAVAGRPDGM
jgi:zinc protease